MKKRTKIVATLGPASSDKKTLRRMVEAGLNVVRLNMSHGTHEEHRRRVELVRSVESELKTPLPILVDLCGPKIRIGKLQKEPLFLHRGDTVILTTGKPQKGKITVNYPNLHKEVKKGEAILLADGAFRLRVKEVRGRDIVCEVLVGGPLTSHKGVNLPHSKLSVPALTEKDREDVKFAVEVGADFIALSFVRTASDVLELKELLKSLNSTVPVIAKIEKPEAVKNVDEILKVADGLMVARGDLGVELPIEKVPVIQKQLIRKANEAGKPVITATQMLKSMVDLPVPTRAEVTDVANAVLDGTDALMLSEETAVGKYPVKVVKTMAKVAREAEKIYPYKRYMELPAQTLQDSLAKSACNLSREVKVKAIIPFTRSGATAIAVAKYRPPVPIYAVTHDRETFRRLNLVWGVEPLLTVPPDTTDKVIAQSVGLAASRGIVKKGDKVIVLAGAPTGVPGTTNLLKVVTVN
ncbi:pyruvate kinase [Thermovibrio ammonificans]|uniref:Pyruvate kinase n=1 Tax=Thermovibrio ammonificans (strain DSM 15698 / JCM 12110 / HB-1) TaxID=648996 RepID=E8T3B0_THEA1|nr:pyruvate kinase [Thermovibrio ammonificans]ADU97242.1 pyruvate kinase [Thermovibrio ammonificans HB-1]